MRRNIELKARCADLERAAAGAQRLGAREVGELQQVDTYFLTLHGRFKLRETEGREAELIWYDRPDLAEARDSVYHVLRVPQAAEMKDALARALGVRRVVRKRRRLWMWENVRIHLDAVEGLGTFVEFEAVMEGEDEGASHARIAALREAMGLGAPVAGSYGEMMRGDC